MVKVGNHELLESITVIDVDSEPISVNLEEEEIDLTFLFNYIKDEKESGVQINCAVVEDYTAELKTINVDVFLVGRNTKLISLGTLKERNLCFNFRVSGLTNC